MSYNEEQYLNLLQYVYHTGTFVDDRTGTGCYSAFGGQLRFDLQECFPILTTKKVFWRGVVEELLWMLRGETSVKPLQEKKVHIWDEWADENGNLGPVYGAQWRDWQFYDGLMGSIDQMYDLVKSLTQNPNSRRHIVSAWNPPDIPSMALPPCHCFFQCHVRDGKYLSLQLYQRSADMFLGIPFNIASYALLTHMLAHRTGLIADTFVHTFGDYHIYANHKEAVEKQLSRNPSRELPQLKILASPTKELWDYTIDDFELVNYSPQSAIKAEVSV